MALPKIIADFETQLATALAIGATSLTLSSAEDDDGVALPAGLYYFTIDNGTSAKEYIRGTLSGSSLTDIYSVSRQGAETSGVVRAHRVGASVIMTDFATYKKYIDEVAVAGAPDASATQKGLVEIPITAEIDADTRLGATGAVLTISPDILALSKYGLRLPSAAEKAALPGLTGLTGAILPYAGRSAPSGYLLCNGAAVSRATYADLFAVLAPSGVFTVTIASPAVFSKTAHGLVAGDRVHFTTTGALPTGLSTNTDYYVISAGLTADAFEVALTPGGAAVNTSGSQSGVHTVYASAWGKGDGLTTFNLPDLRGKIPAGLGQGTMSLSFEPAAVSTGDDWITVINGVYPSQGQPVVFTTTGGLPAGLSLATTYYVIRLTTTTFALAASQADANAATPVKINLTSQGTGVHTMTYTTRSTTVLGIEGGEDTHGLSVGELAAHTHEAQDNTGGANAQAGAAIQYNTGSTGSTGGDGQHNIWAPHVRVNYIIKT